MTRRRPLFLLTLGWMLGILAGREIVPLLAPLHLWLIVLSSLALAIALYRLQYAHWPLGLLVVTVGLGALFYSQDILPVARLYPLLESLNTIRGVVTSYPIHRPERSSFTLQPEGLPGALQIFYYHAHGKYKSIHYGDELEVQAQFEIPWEFEDFNYREHLLTRKIWGVGTLWSSNQIRSRTTHKGHLLLQWGYQTRLHLFELIDRYVPPPGSALLKGLLFGERGYLSGDIEAGFRDAGVMHVLAVSGMNVGILVALFWGVLWLFRLSATQIYLAILPLVFVYLLVVGFEVSLVRASLMFAFVTLGWVIAERGWILKSWVDPLQGLSAAALVILIATPQALYDVSFQLSFAATAGILISLQLLLPSLQKRSERLRWPWGVSSPWPRRIVCKLGQWMVLFVLISVAAQFAVAPILAYHFHRVYLGALLANLIVVPLATLALWLGVCVLLAAELLPALIAVRLGSLEGGLLNYLIEITQFFAHLPGAYFLIDRGLQLATLVVLPLLLSPATLRSLQLAFSIIRIFSAASSERDPTLSARFG